MPSIGVVIAIIQQGRVLLTQRDDFACWCLPGGAIEDAESLEQAATREVSEETGLQVEIEGTLDGETLKVKSIKEVSS